MRVLTERGAEKFLEKEGFSIIKTAFVNRETNLENTLKKFKFPVVLKISSKKIVHKSKVNGIKKGIVSIDLALKAFRELKKIKGFEGVLVQEQIKGKEYLIGLKKTEDFGYVIGFGEGGSKVEINKKVEFRVCCEGVEELSKDKRIRKVINKLCGLSKKYPIDSLDINPLILENGKALVVDAQIFI